MMQPLPTRQMDEGKEGNHTHTYMYMYVLIERHIHAQYMY